MVRSITLLATVYFTFVGGPLSAQKPLAVQPLDQNAALSYWQAFALLPQIGDEMREKLASAVKGEMRVSDDRVSNASQAQSLKWAKDLSSIYDPGQDIMSSSPNVAITKEEELMVQLRDPTTGNPLGELFLPSFASARKTEAAFVTRKRLLKAAFALFKSGPDVLNRPAYRDPFGDGPFELQRVEDGAELVADFKLGDTPIKLQIPGFAE